MPFDDFIDLNDDLTLNDLEKLDRQADETIKKLEKAKQKAGPTLPNEPSLPQTRSGPMSNLNAGTDSKQARKQQREFERQAERERKVQERQDKKIERKNARLAKKVNKDEVKQFGKQGKIKELFGNDVGGNLFSIGKNPLAFFQNSLIGAAGVGFALQIVDTVLKEIQRLDKFFKIFVDIVDDRVDQLRSKQLQAEIAAGLTQTIITTESGNINARDSYNTFTEFSINRGKLEDDFAIRNTSGYE